MKAFAVLLAALLAVSAARAADAAFDGGAAVQEEPSNATLAGTPCSEGGGNGLLGCLVDPCDFASCGLSEDAYCEANLCTCMPEWFVGDREAVVCDEAQVEEVGVVETTGDCLLHKDSGACDDHLLRYYFNGVRGRCEAFIWGGCGGNKNNFATVSECEEKCLGAPAPAVSSEGPQVPRRLGRQCGTKGHRCGEVFQCCREFICCDGATGGSMCMAEGDCPNSG